MIGQYECKEDTLKRYHHECQRLLKEFPHVSLQHIPRAQNQEANHLAQSASGYRVFQEVLSSETSNNDWRVEIADYLRNPSQKVTRKLRFKSTKYVLLDGQLYYKIVNGVLLKCLNQEKAKVLMGEVHERICGAHQSTYKMKWIIRRTRYFWPIIQDCFEYYKGCQDCQRFGNIQKSPASAMNPIIKPWPFRGWGIDLIGQIFPPSSK